MQKGFGIVVLLCCAAGICQADDAPPVRVNVTDANAMENVPVLTYSNTLIPTNMVCPSEINPLRLMDATKITV